MSGCTQGTWKSASLLGCRHQDLSQLVCYRSGKVQGVDTYVLWGFALRRIRPESERSQKALGHHSPMGLARNLNKENKSYLALQTHYTLIIKHKLADNMTIV